MEYIVQYDPYRQPPVQATQPDLPAGHNVVWVLAGFLTSFLAAAVELSVLYRLGGETLLWLYGGVVITAAALTCRRPCQFGLYVVGVAMSFPAMAFAILFLLNQSPIG
jgi:hypothetical protein